MATLASARPTPVSDTRFFLGMAIVMALINVAAFSLFAIMGISSFDAPLYVHLHAFVFFGWVVLLVVQASLATSGMIVLHRALGYVAVGWTVLMLVVGTATTVIKLRYDQAPFFFTPAQFLIMNPASVLVFAALVAAAFVRRRDRDWHMRLVLGAMAGIMGPAFGRLLPAPVLMYRMQTAIFIAMLLFPLAGMARDWVKRGRVHPAWLIGLAGIVLVRLVSVSLGESQLAVALYDRVVAGSPGAANAALEYPPPPFPGRR